ncbi:hypothetical protein [Pseudonocardia spinosispora]|uniref:hypothetical protein n=1 Tax=Pseudonocardia spinosispora TaxID=103441 RepID=UPI00041B7266|nr:hypothetical protein [Pseudonocardia spinosispora]
MPENEDVQPEPEEPSQGGEHELPDGAPVHPLIDLTRDPTPGKPDHARPDDES